MSVATDRRRDRQINGIIKTKSRLLRLMLCEYQGGGEHNQRGTLPYQRKEESNEENHINEI